MVFVALALKSELVVCFLGFSAEQKLKPRISCRSEFASIAYGFEPACENAALLLFQYSFNYIIDNTKQQIQSSEIRNS